MKLLRMVVRELPLLQKKPTPALTDLDTAGIGVHSFSSVRTSFGEEREHRFLSRIPSLSHRTASQLSAFLANPTESTFQFSVVFLLGASLPWTLGSNIVTAYHC